MPIRDDTSMENKRNENAVLYGASNIIKKMKGFNLVINSEAPNMMVVDEIGKRILELCEGYNRRGSVVEKISTEFDCDPQNVEHFLDSMITSKFIAENSPMQFIRDNSSKLQYLQLHLTQACNLRCRHCYFSSGQPFADELTDKEYLDLVKSFKEMGITGMSITGGEPFLRRDLLSKLLSEASLQCINEISLSTNGTLLTENDAALLKKYHVKTGVSLDGATAKTHDYIRGTGVFKKAIKALQMLQRVGVQPTIGYTIMKANIKDTDRVIHLAKKLKVSGISFNIVRVKGRAQENMIDAEISAQDATACLINIWKASRKLGVKTSVESLWESIKTLNRRNLCGAGKTSLSIAANGDVYPCDAFHGEASFRAGNIKERPLLNIWRESPVLKPFLRIGVNQVEGCSNCDIKYICGGGCMGDNYEANDTLFKVAPICAVHKKIHWQMISELAKEMWTAK